MLRPLREALAGGTSLGDAWLGVDHAAGWLVGSVGLYRVPEPGVLVLGYSVYPTLERQGYASEMAWWAMQRAAESGAHVLRATIPHGHFASMTVARRAGLQHVGETFDAELGMDVLVFERRFS
ncbi:MAG: GNAT family N-acetyltransferase [Gemmatimonadales bacterium]|nr:GNAT family N-acetyltransferase [Gemmatimonadales bacterium]